MKTYSKFLYSLLILFASLLITPWNCYLAMAGTNHLPCIKLGWNTMPETSFYYQTFACAVCAQGPHDHSLPHRRLLSGDSGSSLSCPHTFHAPAGTPGPHPFPCLPVSVTGSRPPASQVSSLTYVIPFLPVSQSFSAMSCRSGWRNPFCIKHDSSGVGEEA